MRLLENTDVVLYTKQHSNTIMLHVCNDIGVMGSGVAAQVKEHYPCAHESYRKFCVENKIYGVLGSITYSSCKRVVNMIAQDKYYGYNKDFTRRRFLNYGALAMCLSKVAEDYHNMDGIDTVVIPSRMGSDRAGADWKIVLEMVEFFLGDLMDIVVCEYWR